MKKAMIVFGLILVLAFAFTACGGGEVDVPVNEDGKILCPLDGQVLDSAEDHGDYVFIVSIDNGAGSEPQSGIGQADLLIEIPVESGINRFLAFFYHSTPDTIGPVRSARHYMYDITNAYNTALVHCGGSPQAYELIDSGAVMDIDEMNNGEYFWRDSSRKAPHNLYTSYEKLSEKASALEYDAVALSDCPSFNFMTEDDVEALTYGGVDELLIPYGFKRVLFQWDETEKRYQRYSASDLSIDAADGSSVMADNVVVLYVDNYTIPGDDSARKDMEISEGEGLVMQYGNVIEITWTCNPGEGFIFMDAATGEEIKLVPGKTIINIADPGREPAEYASPTETEEGAE